MTDLQEVPSPFGYGGVWRGLPDEVLAGLDDNRATLYCDLLEAVDVSKAADTALSEAQATVRALETQIANLVAYRQQEWPRGSQSDELGRQAKAYALESQALLRASRGLPPE
jgi:hypothetical protein